MTQSDLYQQLTAAIGISESKIIPKIFEMLADADEAKVVLAAAPPATVEEIAERSGVPAEKVEKRIDPLFKKGLLYKSSRPGVYYRVKSMLQFHDATILAPGMTQPFFDLWKEYHETEFDGHMGQIQSILPRSAMRVLPVDVVIQPDLRVAYFDDVRHIVENARNLAVTDCTCRVVDGGCGKTVDVCIQVDKAADYAIDRGSGRQLTKEETLEMLKKCGEEGLVHTVGNSRGLGHIICNCCEDCCINWVNHGQAKINFTAPSRFAALVDPERCTGCEICAERCFFEAVSQDTGTSEIDGEKCMGCGLCVITCEDEAIAMKETRPEEFVPEQ
ncbi:MAG: 4Fe-4S ferredoxin [Proteobacteria bacterium]|nr:4Fe-4S ferredoxin [Pseudomonadota bacterium]